MRFFQFFSLAIVVFMLFLVACEIDNTVKTDEIWTYHCYIENEDTGEKPCNRTYYLPAGSDPEKATDRYLQRILDDCCPSGSCQEKFGRGDYSRVCDSSGGALR